MDKLKIDPDFKNLIPPLAPEELAQLEANIAADGCRDPLVVWNGIILDGHNRYEICRRLKLTFKTAPAPKSIKTREDAEDWIDGNQLGRRNLTPDAFRLLLGRIYNRSKKAHGAEKGGRGNQYVVKDQIEPLAESTADKLAAKHGVSAATVKRAGRFAEHVEEIQETEPELAAQGQMAVFEEAKKKMKPHISYNSGDNEWYTPEEYIKCARSVMGGIDLDPASSSAANRIVSAKQFYSEKDDGLKRKWTGRIWMNPPYAADLVWRFIEKLAEAVSSGEVKEAMVLVNNATETRWFRNLMMISSHVCFPTGRIKFWKPGSDKCAPLQGQAIAYIGSNGRAFVEQFAPMGTVVKVIIK